MPRDPGLNIFNKRKRRLVEKWRGGAGVWDSIGISINYMAVDAARFRASRYKGPFEMDISRATVSSFIW